MDHPLDHNTIYLIALGILALVAVAFFAVFRGEGALSIKTIFGRFSAKGKNPAPPSAMPSGVRIEDAAAGRNVRARADGTGGVDLRRIAADGDIEATHTPVDPSPK